MTLLESDTDNVEESKFKGKKIIWIMGGPGTGRSYAADKINSKLNLTHISSKEVLKNHMTNAGQDDELSNHEVPRGESVSNEVINKLISEAVNETVEISNGFIIDGYPINQEQADSFCEHIAPPNIVICLTVSNDRALQRLSLNDTSEEQRKYVDKRLEVWNTETKPVGERYNAVFVSAERKCPSEVICEIIQQIRIKTHSSN